jgi:AraC family transcriptional activator of tynA and feaB
MQTIFSYSGPDYFGCRGNWANMMRDEFADCEVDIEPGDVRAFVRKGLAQPITFMRGLTSSGISFRRCWRQIRSRQAAVRLLYFVLQGEMEVANSRGSYKIAPGRWGIINADEPFFKRTFVGGGGNFEAALAVVPEQLVLTHMPWAKGIDAAFEVGGGNQNVVNSLFDVLSFECENLSRKTAAQLATAFLQALSESVADQLLCVGRHGGLVDKRFADIQASIQKHLTCCDLSQARVAADCGISPRYLSYVLKKNATSFSDLLWGERLLKAREWLVSESLRRYPIHNIACMAGFKSAPHFSRMFKETYHLSPREYRENHLDQQANAAGRCQA